MSYNATGIDLKISFNAFNARISINSDSACIIVEMLTLLFIYDKLLFILALYIKEN